MVKSKEKWGEIMEGEIVENEREIRLSMEEFETLLRNAKLIKSDEAVHGAWIEPGELVIEVVQ